jgi:hypothetical protein
MTVETIKGVLLVVDVDGTVLGGYTAPGITVDIKLDDANNVVGIVKSEEK